MRFIQLLLRENQESKWDDIAGEMVLILFQGWIGAYSLGTISNGPLVRWLGEEKCNKPRHVASSSRRDIEPSACAGEKLNCFAFFFRPRRSLFVFVSNVDSRFAIQLDRVSAWKILTSASFRVKPSSIRMMINLDRNQLSRLLRFIKNSLLLFVCQSIMEINLQKYNIQKNRTSCAISEKMEI